MGKDDKPLIWLEGEIKTPPFSVDTRTEAEMLLRSLQMGEKLTMPQSRPMPSIGSRCHELRVRDKNTTRRIIYRTDSDAIVIGDVFTKKTQKTPQNVIDNCKKRFKKYDKDSK